MEQLFGFPIYRSSIKSNSYNKKNIIKVIKENYLKSPTRNYWDVTSHNKSDIHHSLWDDENSNFKKPDYSSLLPIYNNKIKKYLNELHLIKNINYSFQIVNYTCMTKGQKMRNHIHVDCDFSGIHYICFDKKFNDSTLFINTQDHSKYLKHLRPNLRTYFNSAKTENSYLFEDFKFATKEDDIIIFPSMLEHSVPVVESEKERITIAFNIKINA